MNESLHWTKQPPTVGGYYGYRTDLSYEAQIVRVKHDGRRVCFFGDAIGMHVSMLSGEWYGPIRLPGGDAIENCVDGSRSGPIPEPGDAEG